MSAPVALDDPAAREGELARIRALTSAIGLAEARLYGAVREGRNPPAGSGRPVLTWPELAAATGLPRQTLESRVDAYERRLAERLPAPTDVPEEGQR